MQDYLNGSLEFEPDAEYVDGEIEERPMGEWDQTTWQQAIELWFVQHRLEWTSPDDRMPRVLAKLEDYEQTGIRSIFVVNPKTESLYKFEGGALKPAAKARYHLTGHPEGFVDWPAIVGLLD